MRDLGKRKRKRGRPRKSGGSAKDKRLRELWRNASKTYYRKHKKEVLKRAKKK